MTKVELKIVGHPSPDSIQSKLNFFTVKGQDVVMHSALDESAPLNDHLVWMWGHLQGQRRVLKRITDEGAKLVCICKALKGDIHLLPNAAEMLYLLKIELKIQTCP